MIGGFLQTLTFFEGGFGGFLNNLAELGFFTYALPFLLIFAIVFGILTKMNLFKDNSKGIAAIIAIAVGFMSLQFNVVPEFFSKIFPSFGIGLSIVLVILIIVGFFSDPDKPWIKATFFIIAIIIALIVIIPSSGLNIGSWIQGNLGDAVGTILILAVVIIAVIAVTGGFKKRQQGQPGPFDNFNPHVSRT